ncbi:ABC transporter permease [Pectinatus frisingensis]|uniref:ABC transporter permease n=1 Tax=Pectinatus frisingensis TaxID=865 RepID=UPI0018C7F1FF|nr:ABC transporter permease [Pectinatus frisingensis]
MLYDIITAFWRDWIVLKRRMIKFILSRMVAPILYLVAFGWGLGRSITTGGGAYINFLVPGILALNSMNISFNSLTSLHGERVYHKSIEEYFTAPINPLSFAIGKILAAILRGMISSAIIIILAYAFGADFTITPLFLLVLILNCAIFAEIGFYAAMTIASYEDMGRFNTYILLPMSFLCGTFFSPDKLPTVFYYFVHILPLTHTSLLLRGIGSGGVPNMISVAVLLFYVITCFSLCVYVTKKAQE